PEQYNVKPKLQWAYYTFWHDLPTDGVETVIRPDRGWGAFPTNHGLTLEIAPDFADRVRRATRAERFTGGGVPNFLRKPYGPGWALVGDAGYLKDPITAQGI